MRRKLAPLFPLFGIVIAIATLAVPEPDVGPPTAVGGVAEADPPPPHAAKVTHITSNADIRSAAEMLAAGRNPGDCRQRFSVPRETGGTLHGDAAFVNSSSILFMVRDITGFGLGLLTVVHGD